MSAAALKQQFGENYPQLPTSMGCFVVTVFFFMISTFIPLNVISYSNQRNRTNIQGENILNSVKLRFQNENSSSSQECAFVCICVYLCFLVELLILWHIKQLINHQGCLIHVTCLRLPWGLNWLCEGEALYSEVRVHRANRGDWFQCFYPLEVKHSILNGNMTVVRVTSRVSQKRIMTEVDWWLK